MTSAMNDDDSQPIIYYLDDSPDGRRDLAIQLRALFSSDFAVRELPLEQDVVVYVQMLEGLPVAGIFIDQNLDETGEITGYSGVKLASYLRTLYQEMPIYIVTGHPIEGELESEEAGNADSVVAKRELILDSARAAKFRKQFLRRVAQYEKALSHRQQRFRGLLAKKFNEGLDPIEAAELETLRLNHEMPTDEAEDAATAAVSAKIEEISDLLRKVAELRENE